MGWVGFPSLSGLRLSREISLAPPITQHISADLTLGYSSERTPQRHCQEQSSLNSPYPLEQGLWLEAMAMWKVGPSLALLSCARKQVQQWAGSLALCCLAVWSMLVQRRPEQGSTKVHRCCRSTAEPVRADSHLRGFGWFSGHEDCTGRFLVPGPILKATKKK